MASDMSDSHFENTSENAGSDSDISVSSVNAEELSDSVRFRLLLRL